MPFTSAHLEEEDGERYTKTTRDEDICNERLSRLVSTLAHRKLQNTTFREREHAFASVTAGLISSVM